MKTAVKVVIGLVVVLVLAVVLGIVGVISYADSIVKAAIEKGGTYATGVDTTVDSVSLGLFSGEMGMTGFDIANPEGYSRPSFFAMGQSDVAVSLGSLRSDTVRVPYIRLDGVEMSLLRENGEFNYQVILDNLARLSGDAPAEEAEEQGGGKRFIVDEITITDVTVVAAALGQEIEIDIPEIALTDIGSETTGGVLLSQLQGVIIKAIMDAAVKSGVDLPGAMGTALAAGLANVPEIADIGSQSIDEVSKVVSEKLGEVGVGEEAQAVVEDLGTAAKESLEGGADKAGEAIKQGLGGLLGGNKDKESGE
ncbi:MAG: AsmA family protein [Planctomycetota bacterium]